MPRALITGVTGREVAYPTQDRSGKRGRAAGGPGTGADRDDDVVGLAPARG